MEYMDIQKAAQKWALSERRLTALCREGRIPGARKVGKLWQIPDDAEMPLDGRTREYAEALTREAESEQTSVRYTESGASRNAVRKFEQI